MGLRVGAGLGPFSASARIGGGGGGGGDGGGSGDWFIVIAVIAVLSAITAGGTLIDNIGYWIVLNLVPMILLWFLAFILIGCFPTRRHLSDLSAFLLSLFSPLTYFIFMQKLPLVDRDMESLSGPEKQKLYGSSVADLAPFPYWMLAILSPLVCISLILLIWNFLAPIYNKHEQAKAVALRAEAVALRAKHADTQALKTAALRAKHADTLNARQKFSKEQKLKLEESLSRLADATDKALNQAPDIASVNGSDDDNHLELLEASLKKAFTEVNDCLFACQGFLSTSEINNHQKGLLKLRSELIAEFGFKNL